MQFIRFVNYKKGLADGKPFFYCVKFFLKAVFSLLYEEFKKNVAYATEIVQIFKKIKQMGNKLPEKANNTRNDRNTDN